MVLKATGRDTRGQGNASAVITATMTPDGDGTKVAVVTDLTVSGKVAQFGRGVLAEVSAKLIGQFVDALEADLASGGAESVQQEPATGAGTGEAAGPTTEGSGEPVQPAGPRRIDAPEAEPLDLLAVAGGSTLARLLPFVGLAVVLGLLLLRRRTRRRRKATPLGPSPRD